MSRRPNAFARLYRGETSFDFAGRWRRWFALSGAVILIGLLSLGVRGLDLSVDFKGGTIWDVPTSASVSEAKAAVDKAAPGLSSSAQVTVLTNTLTHQRSIEVQGSAKATTKGDRVVAVRAALATLAQTNPNNVAVTSVGSSWGGNITDKAIQAVVIFLVAVSVYIWLRFEGKMAIAALAALLHDILVTVGIYSLSGFQVSPDTVIAFLTILGYSLYDTIVVFDKVQENTRSVASSARLTYTDYVNLSMNQVLARSLNTSFVAIIPILSIEVIGAGILGASTLNDFGLALLIGLVTGAYSSIFIASPLLALLKEREPRYADIRRRLAPGASRRITPAAAAGGRAVTDTGGGAGTPSPRSRVRAAAPPVRRRSGSHAAGVATVAEETPADGAAPVGEEAPADGAASAAEETPVDAGAPAAAVAAGPGPAGPRGAEGSTGVGRSGSRPGAPAPGGTPVPPRSANRPPPRPRKKRRR